MLPPPSSSLVSQGFSPRVVGPSRIAYRQGEVEILECQKGLPLVCGEAPGQREDETGIGFHPEAEAGGLLTRLLQRVRVDRARLNFINVVQQRPPNNELYGAEGAILPWTYDAIEYWKPALHQAIEELQPPVIIGLGRTALETLTGFSDVGTTRGYVCEARIDLTRPDADQRDFDDMWDRRNLHIPTISTYHPAFLNRGQHHLDGVFLRDVLAALEIGEKGWEPPELRVTPTPSAEQFRWFCNQFNPDVHKLTSDIETPNSRGLDEDTMEEMLAREKVQLEIDRMSFCYSSEIGGYSIPFEEPFLALARGLIRQAKVLRGWNWRLFDWPRLLQHGFETQAREEDLMDCWRHLHRTLPASVAFVAPFYLSMPPYKHEAHSQPEWYSAQDAIVEHEIGMGMEKEMRASGQWDTYQRHVVEIISTNHGICTQMARNGLPIDAEKVSAFEAELKVKKQHRTERLSQLVPDSVKVHDPKSGYKTLPKAIKEMIASGKLRGCVLKKAKEGKKEHWYTLVEQKYWVPWEKLTKAQKNLYKGALTDFADYRINKETGLIDEVNVERWVKRFDFLTSSPPQVARLIKHFGHKPKTDRHTKEDTTGDDTLKSLVSKYSESKKPGDVAAVECYRLIRECRAIDKVLGTYVKGWRPASDGLIHATPGIWGDMFRISWRKPNLAATVADKKEIQIAAGFRTCICVPDDWAIVESDWKGMEALLVGFFANDPDYMRLARLGVHDFMGHHMRKLPISLEMSDEELLDRFKWFKKAFPKDRDDAKHCIAEGQLVLTDTGLVPIQNITLANKVWDGVEFVSHDGLVDQGVREVMTYAGLTATPDHQVFAQDGRITTLGVASAELDRLQRTGIGGQALWASDRLRCQGSEDQRLHPSSVQMHEVWQAGMGQQVQFTSREDQWLSLVLKPSFSFSDRAWLSLFEYHWPLQQPKESELQALRRPWHQVPVHLLQALPPVGVGEPAASYLSRHNDRQDRQRGSLHTGEPKTGHPSRATTEQAHYRVDELQGAEDSNVQLRQPLWPVVDFPFSGSWTDGRADHRERQGTCIQGESEELASSQAVVRRARVYDILNTGPRHRFTVSGRLVHNCVHGVGYGMTAYLMAELYEMTRKRAQELIDLLFSLFPKVKAWQQQTMQEAHEKCKLKNAWGYTMPFWQVFQWQQKRFERLRQLWVRFKTQPNQPLVKRDQEALWKIQNATDSGRVSDHDAIASLCYDLGDEAKSALAFLPRDTGAAMLKDTLLALRDEYGYGQQKLRCNAHDSIMAICRRSDVDEVAATLKSVMERPQTRLKSLLVPDGLVIGAEVSVGQSWDKKAMQEWKGLEVHAMQA